MPPRKRSHDLEDSEASDPLESDEPQGTHAQSPYSQVVDREPCLHAMNWAYYAEQYRNLNLELESAHAEFQKIVEDFTGGHFHGSKPEQAAHFDERINKAKQYVAHVLEKEKNLWFLMDQKVLYRIPGALFNTELANTLSEFRSDLSKAFSNNKVSALRKSFHKLANEEIPKRSELCDRLVRPEAKPLLKTSGALLSNPKKGNSKSRP